MMEDPHVSLTGAEWYVMECLWEQDNGGATGRDVSEKLANRVGWSRSTTLTMLSRMEKKGLIASDDEGKKKTYRPLVERRDAVRRETESILQRVYRGSVQEMLCCMTEHAELTDAEIADLYAILDKLSEDRK